MNESSGWSLLLLTHLCRNLSSLESVPKRKEHFFTVRLLYETWFSLSIFEWKHTSGSPVSLLPRLAYFFRNYSIMDFLRGANLPHVHNIPDHRGVDFLLSCPLRTIEVSMRPIWGVCGPPQDSVTLFTLYWYCICWCVRRSAKNSVPATARVGVNYVKSPEQPIF